MYQRFMIADPDSGTLVRFKTEKDIPNNPKYYNYIFFK